MDPGPAFPRKVPKSPGVEPFGNPKSSITCSNVPDDLFEAATAKKHFSKFGRVQKIRLFPKKQMCIVEYEEPVSAERAVLNAGAFDGFMFDVTRSKQRTRRKSMLLDDPDWLPDPEVEKELSALSGMPVYRVPRQKPMDIENSSLPIKLPKSPLKINKSTMKSKKNLVVKKTIVPKVPRQSVETTTASQMASGIESPILVASTQTSMSTFEAAAELHQLRSRTSLTPDEKWRTLDARDRVLRAWGGAGSRLKVGGATIGTCPDMCPEKELLHRQAEHQVMTLETVLGSDGELEPWRAVKQYSRSSADQEIPMCYELRPASVLMKTCSYLLHEIADTTRQVSLADWFHFMWDRFRSIRKDITQQALCCADSIRLVEMCARFHAHCAARLADLEYTQFDQKLNTDNLTKCLQTLKHMYADVGPEQKPNEAEFRGYIALLNLGDANFWWEIKQLPDEIQKSEPIVLAIKIFNCLDNNNYVRFFRLVSEKATYLQACILLRYFNDVRARALARIVKAYAPRGGSRFPASDLMNALAFESLEQMGSFISHYGLRFSKSDDVEFSIILDRHQFIEDSDPYAIERAVELIESKRQSSVCEVIAGGHILKQDYKNHVLNTSFYSDGKLKESALIAEDQGYNTVNDSNKDVQALKAEIQRLAQTDKTFVNTAKVNLLVKPEVKTPSSSPSKGVSEMTKGRQLFSFKPAIPVAPTEIIKQSPEKIFSCDSQNVFSFSKPQNTVDSNIRTDAISKFKVQHGRSSFEVKSSSPEKSNATYIRPSNSNTSVFQKVNEKVDPSQNSRSLFSTVNAEIKTKPKTLPVSDNIFAKAMTNKTKENIADSIFQNKNTTIGKDNIFTKNATHFTKFNENTAGNSIFAKPEKVDESDARCQNIFGGFGKTDKSIFSKPHVLDGGSFNKLNGEDKSINKLSPGTLFKSATTAVPPNETDKTYSIFHSKNRAQTVADNILNSLSNVQKGEIYDFNQNDDEAKKLEEVERIRQEHLRQEEEKRQQQLKRQAEEQELRDREYQRQIELEVLKEKRKIAAEAQRMKEEIRRREEEERRIEEEKRKKLEEEEKKAELKRKAEEEKRRFLEAVDKESNELVELLVNEVGNETVKQLMKDEIDRLQQLVKYAGTVTEEIMTELCNEICNSEMKAEMFWTDKIRRKWFSVWRRHYLRNYNRRCLLEDTPVWLTEKTSTEEALLLRRSVESATLKNMNAIHRGYKFIGELKQTPLPDPYNIVELIRSPLLKRMKQISYPYDKCFFWKITMVSPEEPSWLYRKINIEKWIRHAFSDGKKHESSNLIHVGKYTWNHLMDFAISVGFIGSGKSDVVEAIEGTNGILIYSTETDKYLLNRIQEIIKQKYPYHIIPVAVVMPRTKDSSKNCDLEKLLTDFVKDKVISAYKLFHVNSNNLPDMLNSCTKNALKWLAKHYPPTPPLEIDLLKSVCQRYLGNEIWCNFRIEKDNRVSSVLKDLSKLVKCYNTAIDKLTEVITNEDNFNYPSFALEFKKYLDDNSPYPKPYEFISSSVKNDENNMAIKHLMSDLKLAEPTFMFNPVDVENMQYQIRTYCKQIGWLENSDEIVCKVITVLPNELTDLNMSCENFKKYFMNYNLIDMLNVIVYEKINSLKNFGNRYAIYKPSLLEEFRTLNWLLENKLLFEIKHKAINYEDEDEIECFILAKRRKLHIDSLENLVLDDKDSTMVEENITNAEVGISKYRNCTEAVKQLEMQLEEGRQKSIEFENMLQAALANV